MVVGERTPTRRLTAALVPGARAAPALRRSGRDHGPMASAHPSELPARLAALPAGRAVLDAAAGGDADVYVVGGAIRDLLLGGAPLDLDLVVVGDVSVLAARLGDPGGGERAHDRFGTATVQGAGGVRYDLAQARRESYARPGALPDVEPAGIRDDLARRDFTVNALALGVSGADAGRLVAAPDALEDLAAGRLRVLHPRSFADDPTRLLRLARYAGRLGFTLEPATERFAREAVAAGAVATVTGPRLGAELELLAAEADPAPGFAILRELGVDGALAPGFGIEDPRLLEGARAALPPDGDPAALVLGLAVRGLAPGAARELLDRLGVGAQRRDAALAVGGAERIAVALAAARRPSQVARAVGQAPPEAITVAGELGGTGARTRAREWLAAWRHTGLQIDGEDLIAAGVATGPRIGAGLRAAREAKLDGEATTREAELTVALRAAEGGH